MVNGLLQRNRLAANGLVALLSLFLWIDTAGATLLRDIRVGEYKSFTRIVFELDRAVESRQIIPDKIGWLTVIFTDTYPDLVRKIPIKRAPNIEDLRILTDKNQLSVSLQFINGYKGIVSKFIGHPPRLIVDVRLPAFPLASNSGSPGGHSVISPRGNDRQLHRSVEGPAEQVSSQADAVFIAPPGESLQPQPLMLQPKESAVDSSSLSSEPLTDKSESIVPLPAAEKDIQIRDATAQPALSPPSVARPGRFQYFMAVALIIIILAMLTLLGAIMLSLRRKWRDRGGHLDTKEYLKRQDDRIAALNACIKEQLERYEEA